MATWTSAYINDLPDSAFACIDADGRHYPHHDAQGNLDMPHLRNALSRVNQAGAASCGKAHLQKHADAQGVGKAVLPFAELKASPIDDDAFRLLALPFGGPIPRAGAPRGVDLDGEWFSERTDFKLDWFPFRLVDWHHRQDATMKGAIFGRAVDPETDDEGVWVTVWLNHGERRVKLIKRLAEQGTIYGSSESHPQLVQKADTGEVLVWPYLRQALSTSPQNTLSVIRPLKATLADLAAEDSGPTQAFFDDLTTFLDSLAPSSVPGKAGRVLAARNEARLREAREHIDTAYYDPKRRRAAIAALDEVLTELERYLAPDT